MNTFIRFFIRLLPNEFIEKINAVSLDELDERGLIIWADDVKSGAIIWSKSEITERVVSKSAGKFISM